MESLHSWRTERPRGGKKRRASSKLADVTVTKVVHSSVHHSHTHEEAKRLESAPQPLTLHWLNKPGSRLRDTGLKLRSQRYLSVENWTNAPLRFSYALALQCMYLLHPSKNLRDYRNNPLLKNSLDDTHTEFSRLLCRFITTYKLEPANGLAAALSSPLIGRWVKVG